ncbi:MAG: family 20 glycosylhydrolase [Clostridia bacterium]|nr:family 20 glycosylhydrolase [Clostridia bacterium]
MDFYKVKKVEKVSAPDGVITRPLREIWKGFSLKQSTLVLDNVVEEFVLRAGECKAPTLNQGDEYAINIEENGYCVVATDKLSLIRGVMTLIMRMQNNPTAEVLDIVIACGEIHGNFCVKERTIHVMCPTNAFDFRRFIRFCALIQYKILVVEFRNNFGFKCLPKGMVNKKAISKRKLKKLFKEGNDLGLQIVPMFNSLGHASGYGEEHGEHALLDVDVKYQPLYSPNGWCFNVENPKVIDLLNAIRKELCEFVDQSQFEKKYYHLGFDEAYLYRKKYLPPEKVASFMKTLTDQVVADGYIPFVWGDMLLNKEMIPEYDKDAGVFYCAQCEHPYDLLKGLNPKTIICDWQYSVNKAPVVTTAHLKEKGYNVYGSAWGGTSWFTGRNVTAHVDMVKQGKSDGIMMTTWGVTKRYDEVLFCAYECGLPHNTWSKYSQPSTVVATFYRNLLPAKGNFKKAGHLSK